MNNQNYNQKRRYQIRNQNIFDDKQQDLVKHFLNLNINRLLYKEKCHKIIDIIYKLKILDLLNKQLDKAKVMINKIIIKMITSKVAKVNNLNIQVVAVAINLLKNIFLTNKIPNNQF